MATAGEIFDPQSLAWFARPLYDFGWVKEKPAPPTSDSDALRDAVHRRRLITWVVCRTFTMLFAGNTPRKFVPG